jgi:3-methylfumaryl-CoA hydratase
MSALQLAQVETGRALPEASHTPDEVQLFLYNAALWNAHRIHFDQAYTTAVEGYPALVIAGPLMGDWLVQRVEAWLGDAGRLVSFEYSNRLAAYLGETLTAGGEVASIDRDTGRVVLTLWVRNDKGENLTPGTALVELFSAG